MTYISISVKSSLCWGKDFLNKWFVLSLESYFLKHYSLKYLSHSEKKHLSLWGLLKMFKIKSLHRFCPLFPFQSMKTVRLRLNLTQQLVQDPRLYGGTTWTHFWNIKILLKLIINQTSKPLILFVLKPVYTEGWRPPEAFKPEKTFFSTSCTRFHQRPQSV